MTTTQTEKRKPLFRLGRVVATPGALDLLTQSGQMPFEFLVRHQRGDWGECTPQDARRNNLSVKHGFRILSIYSASNGEKLWIITEADRSSTCLLTPDEY